MTQDSLLDLPNANWGYLQQNVQADGSLEPLYVFSRQGLGRFVRASHGVARHPINHDADYVMRNIKGIPAPIIAAYRAAIAPPRGASPAVHVPDRRRSSSSDSEMARAIAASLRSPSPRERWTEPSPLISSDDDNMRRAIAASMRNAARPPRVSESPVPWASSSDEETYLADIRKAIQRSKRQRRR